MRRMRTSPSPVASSFRSSIRGALVALYKRRAEIDDLIACLNSQGSWSKSSARFTNTRSQLDKISRKASPQFRGLSANSFQTNRKTPPMM